MIKNEYKAIINQAIDYIQKNIEKTLTAEEIAEYCCFSRFYFNRMFKAVTGDSVYSFIKRRKLETAAFLLRTNINMAVTEIAVRVGYSSSNFATAFKEYYGVNATEFRVSNEIPMKDSYLEIAEHIMGLKELENFYERVNSKIEIRNFPETKLIYERFIGNYYDLPKCWEDFCIKMERQQLIRENTRFIGISYDDPLIADENRCIYDVCIDASDYKGTNVHNIEAGLYACYNFHDKRENMGKAFNEIFSIWLPNSGYEIEQRIPLEIYYEVADEQGLMRADLCIPVIRRGK